ncbi:MAG: hypothetical protein ACO3NK_01020 [Prochlorotrichaceae cyanobacterium]
MRSFLGSGESDRFLWWEAMAMEAIGRGSRGISESARSRIIIGRNDRSNRQTHFNGLSAVWKSVGAIGFGLTMEKRSFESEEQGEMSDRLRC